MKRFDLKLETYYQKNKSQFQCSIHLSCTEYAIFQIAFFDTIVMTEQKKFAFREILIIMTTIIIVM